ncbi:glycosyltransferase family 2 protein [Bremerella cremea]|nr:glycosyltransferase family A protein [Bremerella cremea]
MPAFAMISVVIPLPDDRGQLSACLQGFTQQQITVPFEVIVPTAEPVSDDLVAQFPDIRWFHRPGLRINGLYNAGAAEARGKYLYISESHCVPQADCLQQAFNYMRKANVKVACSASDGLPGNFVSDGEQRTFEEDFLRWQSARKSKVAIRGTMIERALWEQVGGFHAEYGHFSEMMIGRKLESLDVRTGFAESSWVSHGNQVCLRELANELIEYGEDECRCSHLAAPDEQPNASREWLQREKLLNRCGRLKREQWLEWARQQIRAIAMNYVPMNSDRRYDYFLNYWRAAIRTGRLNYLATLKGQAIAPATATTKPVAARQAA